MDRIRLIGSVYSDGSDPFILMDRIRLFWWIGFVYPDGSDPYILMDRIRSTSAWILNYGLIYVDVQICVQKIDDIEYTDIKFNYKLLTDHLHLYIYVKSVIFNGAACGSYDIWYS